MEKHAITGLSCLSKDQFSDSFWIVRSMIGELIVATHLLSYIFGKHKDTLVQFELLFWTK